MQDTRTIVVDAHSALGMALSKAHLEDMPYDGTWRVVEVVNAVGFDSYNIRMTAKLIKINSSINDLKITIDTSAIDETTIALKALTVAADAAREAIDRLIK